MTAPTRGGARRTARLVWKRLGLLAPAQGMPPPRPLTFRAAVVIFVLAIVLAYLFVGPWFMLVTAFLAIVTVRFNPDPGRPFAFATVALVVGAAFVSTALVTPGPEDPNILYAQARSLAAQLGSFAGVFFAIATMMYAVTERPRTVQAPPVPGPQDALRRWRLALRTDVSVAIARLGAIGLAVGVGAVVRFALAPTALPAQVDGLVQNLRLGTVYSLEVGGGATPTAAWPPLGPALAAYLPLGAGVIALVVSLGVIGAAALAAWRRAGQTTAVVAAWLVALVPACWSLSLDELVAALFLLLALAVLGRNQPTPGAGFVIGILLGAAVLGRPDAVAAVPVVVVLVLLGRRPDTAPWRSVATILVGAGLVVAGWVNYTASTFGWPFLAESLGDLWRDPVGPGGGTVRLAGAVVLLVLAGWGVVEASPRRRREVVGIGALALWCFLTGLLSGQVTDPLSWSGPLVAVAVAQLRPWAGRGPGRRSGRRGRTSSPASDPASRDAARR